MTFSDFFFYKKNNGLSKMNELSHAISPYNSGYIGIFGYLITFVVFWKNAIKVKNWKTDQFQIMEFLERLPNNDPYLYVV